MGLGSIIGGIAGTAIGGPSGGTIGSALGGMLDSKGKKKKTGTAPFTNVFAGGLKSYIDGSGNLAVSPDRERWLATTGLASNYRSQAASSRSLIPQVQGIYDTAISSTNDSLSKIPAGYGQLTKTAVGAVTNARDKSLSDLRGNIARRRVLGSSFGNDDISRMEAEYAQKEAEVRADSFLKELDQTTQLIDKRLNYQVSSANDTLKLIDAAYGYEQAAFKGEISEMELQREMAMSLITGVNQRNQQNAETEYNNALAAGKESGQLSSLISSAGSSILDRILKGSSKSGNFVVDAMKGIA